MLTVDRTGMEHQEPGIRRDDYIVTWRFNLDDDSQSRCSNCGRNRISLCENGKHRCEKCDWSPEENRIISDDEQVLDTINNEKETLNVQNP